MKTSQQVCYIFLPQH